MLFSHFLKWGNSQQGLSGANVVYHGSQPGSSFQDESAQAASRIERMMGTTMVFPFFEYKSFIRNTN
ncbi:hypothetical protein N7474_010615 [Penicillium riverlandense]|uniref:uncharacterized protein n=1 Tax=Penicillium riverlandense TaxID=1903569 RepID=UPI00254902D7|nr:uncharacterized protein N7474_010615 [Penicillium riverlandense]KAJ5807023.1 hypothetical protein N7474_010615 [Penicillium riverlandense]